MMFRRFITTASAVVLMAAMAISATVAQGPSASVVAAEIARIREQWASDLREKRLDSIAMLYAPDASFISGGSGRVTGRPAIRALCQSAMAVLTSTTHFHSVRIEGGGDLAYDSGDYDETTVSMSDGVKQHLKGSYLMVFKRQADGKWLIAEQMWTEAGK
jgi:uncharacterized protein (TIGR02246 family)